MKQQYWFRTFRDDLSKEIRGFFTVAMIFPLVVAFTSGCAPYWEPLKTTPANLGIRTASSKTLSSLPAPKEKIVVAVYKFRDQTGQYKPSSTSSSFSTAVTQGATSILLRALEESGWFIPIEREGLSNLLNERKIIRSSRAEYLGNKVQQEEPLLPPLLFAGVLLEGGIISYETNILTGGAGVKYFGVGASGQYREDRVTVYLRATSTQNGRILKTVYTTKTILSQLVDVGLFRFVNFQRLLEVETGYSYNEPADLCVTEAIEKAVQSLVIEGITDNLWELSDKNERGSPVLTKYAAEKKGAEHVDAWGQERQSRGTGGVTMGFGGFLYSGDYPNSLIRPMAILSMQFDLHPSFQCGFSIARGAIATDKWFESSINVADAFMQYRFLPGYTLSPYLIGGFGVVNSSAKIFSQPDEEFKDKWYPTLLAGIGIEFLVNESIGIHAILDNHYLLTDKLDALTRGNLNDYFWGGRIGFTWYRGN